MLYKLMFHIDFKNIGTTLVCFQGAGGGGGGGEGKEFLVHHIEMLYILAVIGGDIDVAMR